MLISCHCYRSRGLGSLIKRGSDLGIDVVAGCRLQPTLPLAKWIMPDNGDFLPPGQLLLPCQGATAAAAPQQQQQHPSNMLPLADRSLNKITFKFNCKCILSVGFAAAAAGAVNCNHVAHFSLAGRGPISSPQPRDWDAGLLQSNVIIFAIYTFSCFCSNKLLSILPFEPQKAAPENLEPATATWSRL